MQSNQRIETDAYVLRCASHSGVAHARRWVQRERQQDSRNSKGFVARIDVEGAR